MRHSEFARDLVGLLYAIMAVASLGRNGTPTAAPQNSAFVKKLASSSKKTREKGVALLAKWLSARDPVVEADLKKLWKGLFYCMWHTDKAAAQADLARSFAALLQPLSLQGAAAFFAAFLVTIRREWAGLDRLRMDKFYDLIRQMVASILGYLDKHRWQDDAVQLFMQQLRHGTLLAGDNFAALGVNLHLADIYVDELLRHALQRGGALPPEHVPSLLDPFIGALAEASAMPLLRRVHLEVFGKVLHLQRVGAGPPAAVGGRSTPPSPLAAADLAPVAARLFELAAAPQTAARNRKLLYEVHGEFTRAARDRATASARVGGGAHGPESGGTPVGIDGGGHSFGLADGSEPSSLNGPLPGVQPAGRHVADVAAAAGAETEQVTEGASPGAAPQDGKKKKKRKKRKAAEGIVGESEGGKKPKAAEAGGSADSAEAEAPALPPVCTAGPSVLPSPLAQAAADNPWDDGGAAAPVRPDEDGLDGYTISRSALATLPDPPAGTGGSPPPAPPAPGPGGSGRSTVGEELSAEALSRVEQLLSRRLLASPPLDDLALHAEDLRPPASASPAGAGRRRPAAVEQRGCRTEPPRKRTRLVCFNLRGNQVFAKNGPVPPLPVRTPPSATPRGSALKKNVAPGPINARKLKSEEDISKLTPRGLPPRTALRQRVLRRLGAGKQFAPRSTPARSVKLFRITDS